MAALAGGHAFVTGGGSGIGLACAKAFAADGARVTIVGRNAEKLERASAELAQFGEVATAEVDVGDESALETALLAANEERPVSIALANAGVGGLSPTALIEAADWRAIMQTNLDGTFYTFKHAARLMMRSGGGALCAISSIAGLRTHRFMSTYCVSKAGVDMLVRNMADELGTAGIRVNSVCPGLVDTEIAAGLFATQEVHADYLDCMPLGRTGEVADIAQAVRFLCGPESRWVTGVNLPVDGGHHLRRGPDLAPFSRMLFGDDATEGKL